MIKIKQGLFGMAILLISIGFSGLTVAGEVNVSKNKIDEIAHHSLSKLNNLLSDKGYTVKGSCASTDWNENSESTPKVSGVIGCQFKDKGTLGLLFSYTNSDLFNEPAKLVDDGFFTAICVSPGGVVCHSLGF